MNNNLRTLLAFSFIGISTAAFPAAASDFEPLRVSVPFEFTAGKTSLPAGDYTVVESDSHVVLIRGARGSAILLGANGDEQAAEKSGLSFQHTDKGYYLKCVHATGRASSILSTTPEPAGN